MIYYFSGTGNSKYVAERLAKYTDDTARFIPEVFDEIEEDIVIDDGSPVGVVFPVYAWQPPAIVMEFLSHVHVGAKSFTYAVATCGSEVGKAMKVLSSVFPCSSAYSITMPENYVALFNVDEPARVEEKLNVAIQRIPQIAAEIRACRKIYYVEEGREATFKTYILNRLFSLFLMRATMFSVDSSCIGCGACETNCPFGTVTLVERKPVWDGKCQMCMSCINKCPVRAIQCGMSRKRGRYVFPDKMYAGLQQPVSQRAVPHIHASVVEKTDEQKKVTATDVSAVEITKSPFFKIINAVDLPNMYDVYRNSDEICDTRKEYSADVKHGAVYTKKETGDIVIKALGDMRQIAECSVSYKEIHLARYAEHVFLHNAEYVAYAVKGEAALLHSDDSETLFPVAAVVHFSGGTVHSVVNKNSDEFIMLIVESV